MNVINRGNQKCQKHIVSKKVTVRGVVTEH
ncbi:hypothetical protein VPHD479_0367 [Vibrio phage D479]